MRQILREDVFSSSLGPVWMSRSKVKGHSHQGQKTRCALPSPPAATEWNEHAAHHINSSRRDHSVAAGGG